VDDGNRIEKPFAAIALGLAAPRLEPAAAERVRKVLLNEFVRNRDVELAGALAIGVGLSGAEKARDVLLARARDPRLMSSVRGPAIQALGLVGDWTPEVEKVVHAALDDRSDAIVMDAALALGLLGRRSSAKILVEKLRQTKWEPVQRHMVAALSHLGSTAAIDPLIETLKTRSLKHTIRESAAAAMGILVDPRERDPLFTIDASVNVYGLTDATRELVRIW
jgi:HEAT repeat protein